MPYSLTVKIYDGDDRHTEFREKSISLNFINLFAEKSGGKIRLGDTEMNMSAKMETERTIENPKFYVGLQKVRKYYSKECFTNYRLTIQGK